MARPSKKDQRREEIIDAYERCVVRFGVAGATLQQVADESELARPLLHHNIGNRDDLLRALLDRLEARVEAEGRAFEQYLPETGRCSAMLDLLFDHRYASDSHETLLYQALLVAAQDEPDIKQVLIRWHDGFVQDIAAEVSAEYPHADSSSVRAVATGIVALYFNADSMAALAPAPAIFEDSRMAARRLLETL